MAAMSPNLQSMFGPPLDGKERMRRYRIERAELLLEGHDPDSIMDRWEDEQKRWMSSSGRRIRIVFEMDGDVLCPRKVVEDVANGDAAAAAGQIWEGKWVPDGDASVFTGQIWEGKWSVKSNASAVAAPVCQISEEKEESGGDAPASAIAASVCQISEEKEESGGDAPACAVAAWQSMEEKEAANGDGPSCAQIREMQVAGGVVGGFISV